MPSHFSQIRKREYSSQTVRFNISMPQPQLPLFAGQSEEDIRKILLEHACPPFRVKQILDWFWLHRIDSFDKMNNLPKELRRFLASRFSTEPLSVIKITGAEGGTRKFLSELPDGQCVESVIIPAAKARDGKQSERMTLCISSQVGCAFGCRFCASGLFGFTRNLEPGEIVSQILTAEKLTGTKVNNLVFMGMGEPLANFDNLIKALDIITAPNQLNIGARHITISTSGHAPNIQRLAEYPKQIRLALSLHGATNEIRNRIMPINKKWPLEELKKSLIKWSRQKKQKISLEYILIKDVNDSLNDAQTLIAFTKNIPVKINLIPYNTVEGLNWERPPLPHCLRFKETLEKAGMTVTMRYEKGHDINAACGQLRLKNIKKAERID